MNNSTVLTDEDGILMWVYKGQTDHSPLISAIRQQLPKSDRTENPSGFLVDIDSSDRIPVHIRSQDNLSLLGEYKIQSIGQSSLVLEEINTDKNRPISLKEFIRLRVFFHRSPIELNKALVSAVAENLKQITVHFKSDESVISTGDYREILLFLYRKLKGRVAETKFLSHQLS